MKGSYSLGTKTAALNVGFIGLIPPHSGAYTKINRLVYTTAGTPHTLNIMKSQGKTTTTAASSASGTTLTLASISIANKVNGESLSENLAANDWLVVQHTDGTWGAYMVTSVSGLVVTLSTSAPAVALAKDVASGAVVYGMYETSRATGKDAVVITTTASSTQTFETYAPEVGIAQSNGTNEPLLFHSSNVTAAGSLVYVSAVYSRI